MSSTKDKIVIDMAVGVVGKWKQTYAWIPVFSAFAAFAFAFSAGANNLAAPFSTPIGSGALTLLKASTMACVIYASGAGLASKSTVDALFSDFLKENQPNEGFLMWSMVVVLITAAIWLAIATYWELPVSSQQSAQCALLGTILVTQGFGHIPLWNKNDNHNFNGGGLLWIFLEWTIAPLVACICSYFFFHLLKALLLRRENSEKRILIFFSIVFGLSAGLLCLVVMSQIIESIVSVNTWVAIVAVAAATLIGAVLSAVVVVPLVMKKFEAIPNYKSNKRNGSTKHQSMEVQGKTNFAKENEKKEDDVGEMLREFMQTKVLETVYEEEERSWASPEKIRSPSEQTQSVLSQSLSAATGQSTPFKQLLESTPNKLVQSRNFRRIEETTLIANATRYVKEFVKSIMHPQAVEYDRQTLIRHALAEKYDEMEDFLSFPHLLASCIFALIQSASEIAPVVSPFEATLDVFEHRSKYSGNGEDVEYVNVSRWFRAIGGGVAAMGFWLSGWRLSQCLGGKVTYMSNSRGLVSQLSTVAAVIIVRRMNLPVSSVHAFVGSLLGVGLADDLRNVNWKLVIRFICGWILTVILCCGIAYVTFSASIHSPAYVVP